MPRICSLTFIVWSCVLKLSCWTLKTWCHMQKMTERNMCMMSLKCENLSCYSGSLKTEHTTPRREQSRESNSNACKRDQTKSNLYPINHFGQCSFGVVYEWMSLTNFQALWWVSSPTTLWSMELWSMGKRALNHHTRLHLMMVGWRTHKLLPVFDHSRYRDIDKKVCSRRHTVNVIYRFFKKFNMLIPSMK